MGLESRCAVRVEDGDGHRDDADAKVELDGDALIVRGAARVRVPRGDITELSAHDGILTVTHAAGTVRLMLGSAAEKWRTNPAIGNGAMWIVHPNGTPDVADTKIFAVADGLGFVCTKVMSFSTGMSAERLSVRKAK